MQIRLNGAPTTITLSAPTPEQETYLREIEQCVKPLSRNDRDNFLIPGPNFDASLPPTNHQNVAAAKVRHWTFDPNRQKYLNRDGALVADKFGQLL